MCVCAVCGGGKERCTHQPASSAADRPSVAAAGPGSPLPDQPPPSDQPSLVVTAALNGVRS